MRELSNFAIVLGVIILLGVLLEWAASAFFDWPTPWRKTAAAVRPIVFVRFTGPPEAAWAVSAEVVPPGIPLIGAQCEAEDIVPPHMIEMARMVSETQGRPIAFCLWDELHPSPAGYKRMLELNDQHEAGTIVARAPEDMEAAKRFLVAAIQHSPVVS